MSHRFLWPVAVALLLGGCVVTPANFESEPVVLPSAQGPVTCQLYTPELVIWDRAILRPPGMAASEANAICRAEGQRRADQFRATR